MGRREGGMRARFIRKGCGTSIIVKIRWNGLRAQMRKRVEPAPQAAFGGRKPARWRAFCSSRGMNRRVALFFACALALVAFTGANSPLRSQESSGPAGGPVGLNGLPEVPLSQLSDPGNSLMGKAALAVRPAEWKHAETPHFILHFFHNFVAARVAGELEFYYHAVATELHRDTSGWERKSHVYIFETPEDWHAFQAGAQLDPWTGGCHSEGNLFIQRNPAYKFQDRTLGHETAHLVLYRFFGPAVPLWLNEGYAENSSMRFYSGLQRQRGYNAQTRIRGHHARGIHPRFHPCRRRHLPGRCQTGRVFYHESEKLVRFLKARAETMASSAFLDALSHGSQLESALEKGFGSRFTSVDSLNQEFSAYAARAYCAAGRRELAWPRDPGAGAGAGHAQWPFASPARPAADAFHRVRRWQQSVFPRRGTGAGRAAGGETRSRSSPTSARTSSARRPWPFARRIGNTLRRTISSFTTAVSPRPAKWPARWNTISGSWPRSSAPARIDTRENPTSSSSRTTRSGKSFLDQTPVPQWAASFAHGDELFLNLRNTGGGEPFDSRTLAHETTHAVVARLYPEERWPLWLNEGFAEYMGAASVAARKGQTVRRHETLLSMATMSLDQMQKLQKYPDDTVQVAELYETGEKLVRFMMTELPKDRFPRFAQTVNSGKTLPEALQAIYPDKISSYEDFQRRFARFTK